MNADLARSSPPWIRRAAAAAAVTCFLAARGAHAGPPAPPAPSAPPATSPVTKAAPDAPPAAPPTKSVSAPSPEVPAVRSMALADAVAQAKLNQPRIRAAKARVSAAKADANIPRSLWLPTIGLSAEIVGSTTNNTTATTLSTGGALDLPRIGGTKSTTDGTFSMEPHPSTLLGVGVSQELFDFGRISAQTAALDASVDAEEERANATTVDVAYEVTTAFYAVRAAREIEKAAEQAYARALAHRDLAKAAVESGLRSPVDLARAEADLMRFDVGRARAKGNLLVARTQLATIVGVPDAALDAADDPVDTTAAQPINESAAIRKAETANPLIREGAARVKEQEARTAAIQAEARPNLWLTASLTGRAGGAEPSSGDVPTGQGWLPVVPNWDVGVVLSWKLFDGTIGARADASRAREDVRRAELDQVRQSEIAGLRRALVGDEVARTTLPALARARAAAEANYAQVEARWKQGLATVVELADAEALRTEAEINESVGRFEQSRARAAIGRATGDEAWKNENR